MEELGFYTLVQYVHDRARREAANVGVILYTNGTVHTKLATTTSRVKKFFGRRIPASIIRSELLALESRLINEGFESKDQLKRFAQTRAGTIQLTDLRPMRVREPQNDLEKLFNELVETPATELAQEPDTTQKLAKLLTQRGVLESIKKDVVVEIPEFHQKVSVPFAYQNGRFNLIQPYGFKRRKAFDKACRLAVEGNHLFKNPHESLGEMQLVVVGELEEDQKSKNRVSNALSVAGHET